MLHHNKTSPAFAPQQLLRNAAWCQATWPCHPQALGGQPGAGRPLQQPRPRRAQPAQLPACSNRPRNHRSRLGRPPAPQGRGEEATPVTALNQIGLKSGTARHAAWLRRRYGTAESRLCFLPSGGLTSRHFNIQVNSLMKFL